MEPRWFLVGGLAILLLFGCLGASREKPLPVPTKGTTGQLGDSDISASSNAQNSENSLLSNQPLAPPDNGNETGGGMFSESDIGVGNTSSEGDLIDTQDVVEAG